MLAVLPFISVATAGAIRPALVELNELLDSVENKVLKLSAKIEQQHAGRCTADYSKCEGSMFDTCVSELPSGRCDSGIRSPLCGALCGMTFDYSTSTINIPPGQDVKAVDIHDRIKETACYTNALDSMFKQNNEGFNATGLYEILPNQYFGDRHGFFRLYPGRHFETCGEYDPRVRPWYSAGSTAPMSVVVIVDLSGSMSSKIDSARAAAKHLISTLTFADSFAVLAFSGDGYAQVYPRNGGFTYGTVQEKANAAGVIDETTWPTLRLLGQVTNLGTGTLSLDAVLTATFAMWNVTANGATADVGSGDAAVPPGDDACVKALVLLTDSTMGYLSATSAATVYLQQNAAHGATMFIYSLDASVTIDGQAPKALACSVDGVWAAIPKAGSSDDQADAQDASDRYAYYMRQFTLHFQVLLGTSDFPYAVWVEPYLFYPSNLLGTSVSSPVYDRTVPGSPRLAGVAAMDLVISSMEATMMRAEPTLTATEARSLALEELAKRSRKRCPAFATVSECDLQAVRRYSGGEKGLCPTKCWQTTSFDQNACLDHHKYPRPRPAIRGTLLQNWHWESKRAKDRVCCGLGEDSDVNLFWGVGRCRDDGGSSETTLVTAGGRSSRYIFITYRDDWQGWTGAEEICRNQGYRLVSAATLDASPKELSTVEALMQAAGVNHVWRDDDGGNAWLTPGGECGFVGRRMGSKGEWGLVTNLRTRCDTSMGFICDRKSKPEGLYPSLVIGLIVMGALLTAGCCCLACYKGWPKRFVMIVMGKDDRV